MKEKIIILGKNVTTNSDGNPGTRICYIYNDDAYEGVAVNTIWIPLKYKKPEDIIIGKRYELTIFCRLTMRIGVRLTLLKGRKEAM